MNVSLAVAIAVFVAAGPLEAQAPAPSAVEGRPRLALVLGGGSARGIAHIGVLQWLDEHRIPVDVVVGTSMGGLVGGAFATGMSPAELRDLIAGVDWDHMFLGEAPYALKTMRRKDDARRYPSKLRFGLKNGLRAPNALEPGQQIDMLLQRIALPYYDLARFDDLPTPFRCVAVDVRTSETVVLDSGPLWQALRATMSIPGVFAPVLQGERVLIDGGILNNVPTDVARSFNLEGVVAVNVGSSSGATREPAQTYLAALMQTTDVMGAATLVASLDNADVAIRPDVDDVGSLAWRTYDDIISRGYAAAAASSKELMRWSVDAATYSAWLSARAAKRRTAPPRPETVTIAGAPEDDHAAIARQFEPLLGRPIEASELSHQLTAATGSDRYETASADFVNGPNGLAMRVSLGQKSYGPPFLMTGFDVQNVGESEFTVDLRGRLLAYDVIGRNSEARLDLGIGTGVAVAGELYRPLGSSPFFVVGQAMFDRSTQRLFVDEDAVAEYSITRNELAAEFGWNATPNSEVRAGYVWGLVDGGVRIGTSTLPEFDGDDRSFRIRAVYDAFDSAMVPSRGARARGELALYQVTAHDELMDPRLEPTPVRGQLAVSTVRSVRKRDRLFAHFAGGATFGGTVLPPYDFPIGGMLRVGALDPGEVRGSNAMVAAGGYLLGVGRLPDLLGGGVYFGGWLESGSAFEDLSDAQFETDVTAGLLAETFLGPLFLGGSLGAGGNGRVYVSLGPLFR